MKVSLKGLLANAAAQVASPDRKWAEYYSGALEETVGHLEQVETDPELLQEFLEMYSILPKGFKIILEPIGI